MNSAAKRAARLFRERGGILRTHEAIEAGIHPRTLYAMRDAGHVEQAARGVYRLAGLPPLSDPDVAIVAKLFPAAVVCLISALSMHELTTRVPHTVQIATPPGRRAPKIPYPPIETFRFSKEALAAGVEERRVDGAKVRVFNAEKTLADTFKFRNRIGLETAVEALRNYARRKRRRIDLILDYARICRVERIMRPYLEALS
ncbi:MAG: type IV toxin-antitoxin system AbiEi family antitoxin domain-containing protein [Chthoniobacterales bacterium]